MADRWHSVDEVSEHLGVVPDTLYRWIASGRMPAHRIGRQWKFMMAEVDEWVRAGGAASGQAAKTEGRESTWSASTTASHT